MNQFGRALKLSLNHRWNVAACILSSLIVAVLWGGNLTAVYPLVNVIMNDHSLPEWIDDFVELVVPELQRRGLFRTEYEGRTLRENLGLRRPASRYADAQGGEQAAGSLGELRPADPAAAQHAGFLMKLHPVAEQGCLIFCQQLGNDCRVLF